MHGDTGGTQQIMIVTFRVTFDGVTKHVRPHGTKVICLHQRMLVDTSALASSRTARAHMGEPEQRMLHARSQCTAW